MTCTQVIIFTCDIILCNGESLNFKCSNSDGAKERQIGARNTQRYDKPRYQWQRAHRITAGWNHIWMRWYALLRPHCLGLSQSGASARRGASFNAALIQLSHNSHARQLGLSILASEARARLSICTGLIACARLWHEVGDTLA